MRTYHLLKNFAEDHEITLVSFISSRKEAEFVDEIKACCKSIHLVYLPLWRSAFSVVVNIWRGLPLQIEFYRSREMRRLIDNLLMKENFEAVYIHLFRMAPYMAKYPALYHIVDLTDVISREIAGSLPYRSGLSKVIYRFEQPRIAAYERDVAQWADEAWLISEHDRLELSGSLAQANLQTIPNGVDLEGIYPRHETTRDNRLIFVGNLNVFHNIDALRFLILEILPLIREREPNCELVVVGPGGSREVREFATKPGVQLTGFVADLNDILNTAALFIAPLRFSAGIQNKVLEAMAAGIPVVTTGNVNDGLGAEIGHEIVVAVEIVQSRQG